MSAQTTPVDHDVDRRPLCNELLAGAPVAGYLTHLAQWPASRHADRRPVRDLGLPVTAAIPPSIRDAA